MNGIIDKVTFEGLVGGLVEIQQRLMCIKELMNEHRIVKYKNKECIIIETLPCNKSLTIKISCLDDFDREIEVGLNEFWDNGNVTEYILE